MRISANMEGCDALKSAYIALGYTCNHSCLTCPLTTFDRMHRDFIYEDIIKSISEAQLTTDDHVTISGGEPTLNKCFLPVIEYLSGLGVRITILSNSVRFTDDSLVEHLRKVINISKCNVVTAIHSSDRKIHDKLTASKGSFDKTLVGLKNLICAGIPTCVKNIVNGLNYTGLEDFSDFVIHTFPKQTEVQFCVMDYSGRASKNLNMLKIDFQNIGLHLEKALDVFEKSESDKTRKISVIESPLCMVDPYYWKYFKGDCGKLGLYVAPNSETENNISFNVDGLCNTSYPECMKCRAKSLCPGVWNSSYHILGSNCLRPFL